jgi:hypothetical protein
MTAATTAPKKDRNARISDAMLIRAFKYLRDQRDEAGEDNICPTASELTAYLNAHEVVGNQFVPIADDKPKGTRKHESIQSRVSQLRGEIDESTDPGLTDEIKITLLDMLDFRDSVRKDTMSFRDIAINVLGMTLAPANMVPNSGHVGTNGQPVNEMVEA